MIKLLLAPGSSDLGTPLHRNKQRSFPAITWLLTWVCSAGLCAAPASELVDFNVPAGPADKTLYDFAQQAHLYYLIEPEKFRGIMTHSVVGRFSIVSGLRALTHDTGIVPTVSPDHTSVEFKKLTLNEVTAPIQRPQGVSQAMEQSQPLTPLSQVVVTGSHVPGSDTPIGVALQRFDAQSIRLSGATSLGDFLLQQPQIFGGGATPDTRLGVDAAGNAGFGTAINVRGLGSPAVLILVNGQRLAPSGDQAAYIDVTNIPIGAISHIDIDLNSASAIYGSDAIAGVINVFTRDGAERPSAFVQWSSVMSGSEHAGLVYGTLTHKWDTGNFIVMLGGSVQSALPADERSFYSANMSYGGGPNFQPPAGVLPTLSSSDGTQNWALQAVNPTPTAQDFKAGGKSYVNPYQGADIIASQKPMNVYSRLYLEPTDWLSLTVDGFANRRNAAQVDGPSMVSIPLNPGSPYYVNVDGKDSQLLLQTNLLNLLGPRTTAAAVTVYNLSATADAQLGTDNNLSLSVHRASERESQIVTNTADFQALDNAIQAPNGSLTFNPYDQSLDANSDTLTGIRGLLRYDSLSQVQNVTVSLNRQQTSYQGGVIQGALGVELRDQEFQTYSSLNGVASGPPGDYQRHVLAAFSEVKVPVITPDMSLPWAHKLDFDVAIRHEDYSDFGGATTPRAAARWVPTQAVVLTAGWARSFRAPDPGMFDQSSNSVVPAALTDTSGRQVNALVENGNNADLKPERADELTFGAELHLPLSPLTDLQILLDHFDINYNGRIESTPFSSDLLTNSEYGYLVERDPTPAQLQSACASGRYVASAGNCMTTPVQAIINLRLQNVDQLQTRGIDLDAALSRQSSWGKLTWRVDGTYLLQYSETPYPGAAAMHLLNTEHSPINLRFRNTWDWSYRQWDFCLAMNFANHYRDTDTDPNQRIASLATFDTLWRYSIGDPDSNTAGSLEIMAGIQNIANRAPPFVVNEMAAVGYDQENADPYLRTWRLSILKRW